MPSIQDLNAFKNIVNLLGSEPEVVQARDEALEDIQPGENTLPLMPELSAMREALEQRNQEDSEDLEDNETQEQITPVENEVLEERLVEIVMNDELEEQERVEQEENFLEEQIDEEALYPLFEEFDTLFNDSSNTEKPEENPLDAQPLEETQKEVTAEEFAQQNQPFPEEAVPQSVYEMLNTGFGELDSERLSTEILDDKAVEDITPEELETPPMATEIEEPTEPEKPPILAETEDLPTDLAEDEFNPWDEFDDVENLEENTQEDVASYSTDISTYDGYKENTSEQPLSAHQRILHLEEAIKEHRNVDLLNVNEEQIEQEDEELQFIINHDNARDFLLQLSSYPIALKMAIEEEIGERELNEEALETLVDMVINGVAPRHVANYFFSQTGKRILLPKGQRYHAIAKKDDISLLFQQQFTDLALPVIRLTCVGIVLLALLFWLPFYYIYRPIQAYSYYQQGHLEILRDNFSQAERFFTLATYGWPLFNDTFFVKGWPFRYWYLEYAKAYAQRKSFAESTFKLRETLRNYPDYRDAWFEYINLLSQEMGEYAKAEDVIQQYYDRFGHDYRSLIIRGQNYLNWGEVDPIYYEEARLVFSATYSLENKDDLPLLYLLDYYIRTEPYNPDEEQLQKLTSFFLDADPMELEVPGPLFSQVMSKTADYYLNQGQIELAKKLLLNASKVTNNSMEVYRSFANYYNIVGDNEKEEEALNMSLFFLRYRDDRNTTPNLLEKLSLTTRYANFLIKDQQISRTNFLFNALLTQLQKTEQLYLHTRKGELSNIYAMFGNFYYQNTTTALNSVSYYRKAIQLGIQAPYLRYNYGYQLYQKNDFNHAVDQFIESQVHLAENNKIKYALGNSLLQAGNYNSAQGIMEEAYSSIQEELRTSYLLDPQYSKEARDRLFMLVRLANDLGVSYYRETLRSPNLSNEETSMAYFIQAMGYLDILSRENTVALKLPPELLFRPRLLNRKSIENLENSIAAKGLIPGSLPDKNFKQILESKIIAPILHKDLKPYSLDILDPTILQETMGYE